MNLRFTAMILATVAISPAFAQSYHRTVGSGNLNSMPYASNEHNPIHSTKPMYRGIALHPMYRDADRQASPAEANARVPDSSCKPATKSGRDCGARIEP